MDALNSADIVLLGKFGFNQRSRALFHLNTGAQIPIGSRARTVLGVLLERAGGIVPKDEIINAVWPETVVEDGNLTVHIATLRRVLDTGGLEGSCIQTISGRGYCFVGGVTQNNLNARWGVDRREQSGERTPARLSIVVLPFANLSDDREQQYFADGITEDLTADLSRLSGVFVISRNTAFTYQGKRIDTRQIGRELGVQYALEGSVRRSGDQVRVSAQLIDAQTDAHLWMDRFDSYTGDLFALQTEITARIGNTLGVELIRAEAARPSNDPDALDYILRGRAAFANGVARHNYIAAIGFYERALALDQNSVGAQCSLATTLVSRALQEMTDTREADIACAERLIDQVLIASPRYLSAHFAKGQILRAQGRFDEAATEYETVLASNHNSAVSLLNLGRCKYLTGSLEEAIPLMEKAIRLSPRDPFIGAWYSSIGTVHLLQSRIEEAILWHEKARAADPGRPQPHAWLASAYALKGDADRAAAELAEAQRLSGDNEYSSIARLGATWRWGIPAVRALYEATYFVGLRKAGMPEE